MIGFGGYGGCYAKIYCYLSMCIGGSDGGVVRGTNSYPEEGRSEQSETKWEQQI